MVYSLKRIELGSALRVGLALGWLVALIPSLLVAGLTVEALQQAASLLGRIDTYELSFLGQTIANIDFLALAGLTGTAHTIGGLVAEPWVTFAGITVGLTAIGAIAMLALVLLFSVFYNLLAAVFGGLKVELRELPRD